jgi:hypothetical protein
MNQFLRLSLVLWALNAFTVHPMDPSEWVLMEKTEQPAPTAENQNDTDLIDWNTESVFPQLYPTNQQCADDCNNGTLLWHFPTTADVGSQEDLRSILEFRKMMYQTEPLQMESTEYFERKNQAAIIANIKEKILNRPSAFVVVSQKHAPFKYHWLGEVSVNTDKKPIAIFSLTLASLIRRSSFMPEILKHVETVARDAQCSELKTQLPRDHRLMITFLIENGFTKKAETSLPGIDIERWEPFHSHVDWATDQRMEEIYTKDLTKPVQKGSEVIARRNFVVNHETQQCTPS